MPNTSFTPWATSVSTNASEGVIFCLPVTGVGSSVGLFIAFSWHSDCALGTQFFIAAAPLQAWPDIAKPAANVYIRRRDRGRRRSTTTVAQPRRRRQRRPGLDN